MNHETHTGGAFLRILLGEELCNDPICGDAFRAWSEAPSAEDAIGRLENLRELLHLSGKNSAILRAAITALIGEKKRYLEMAK